MAEDGGYRICDVVGVDAVLTRGTENQSGANNRSRRSCEDAASLFDVSVGRHSALSG